LCSKLDCETVVSVDAKQHQINLFKPGTKEDPKSFTFDNVFDANSLQSYIYEETAFSLVDSVIEGYNGTIFAYGQTGCGKTHTMMGSN
jgi:DNA replication protein DnaC